MGHREMMADLRRMAFSVHDLSMVGDGFPDLIIGRQGLDMLVEVKTPYGLIGAYRMEQTQRDFNAAWRGSEPFTHHQAEAVVAEFNRRARKLANWRAP